MTTSTFWGFLNGYYMTTSCRHQVEQVQSLRNHCLHHFQKGLEDPSSCRSWSFRSRSKRLQATNRPVWYCYVSIYERNHATIVTIDCASVILILFTLHLLSPALSWLISINPSSQMMKHLTSWGAVPCINLASQKYADDMPTCEESGAAAVLSFAPKRS